MRDGYFFFFFLANVKVSLFVNVNVKPLFVFNCTNLLAE